MPHYRALLIMLLLAACMGVQAHADTRNGLANALAVTQVGDCVTSVALLHAPNTFERDPLAKPVEHSVPLCLAAAGGINLFLRNEHGPHLWILRAAILTESLLVANNLRVLARIPVGR